MVSTSRNAFTDMGLADPRAATRHLVLAAVCVAVLGALVLWPEASWAQAFGGGMPWEGPICKIVRSLSGPVVAGISVVALVFAGLGWAFGDNDVFKFLMATVTGICIAVLGTQILTAIGINPSGCV